jgi:hypothetical protein
MEGMFKAERQSWATRPTGAVVLRRSVVASVG